MKQWYPAALKPLFENPQGRHYGGFVLAGGLAFATDASILEALTRFAGMSPFLARPFGICAGMVVSWLINRTVTFAMHTPPHVSEFLKFAAVAWSAQAVNYLVFAAILLAVPATLPFIALVCACFVAMFFSYTGYRFGVFRRRGW
jgi:putative flippase GtrA